MKPPRCFYTLIIDDEHVDTANDLESINLRAASLLSISDANFVVISKFTPVKMGFKVEPILYPRHYFESSSE